MSSKLQRRIDSSNVLLPMTPDHAPATITSFGIEEDADQLNR